MYPTSYPTQFPTKNPTTIEQFCNVRNKDNGENRKGAKGEYAQNVDGTTMTWCAQKYGRYN